MHLSELKIWNFRKYGMKGDNIETAEPGLIVHFHEGLNLLVGENDSGKTAVVDAIEHVLLTQSYDSLRLEREDFYRPLAGSRTEELKIECIFRGFSHQESKISQTDRSKILEEARSEISEDDIEHLKEEKLENKQRLFSQGQYVKAFITQNWTLEYEIALSGLKKNLHKAILTADFIENHNELEVSPEIQQQIDEQVEEDFSEWDNLSDTQKAYNIYKPLLDGGVSKAITAQLLAQILKDKTTNDADRNALKKLIEKDRYLAYLCNAIYHVTPSERTRVKKHKYVRDALKMAYVGMSRATHLVCVAMHEDRVKDHLEELKWDEGKNPNGWKLIPLT